MSKRTGQFAQHGHSVHVREICLYLAQSFTLLLGALALRYVDVGPQYFGRLSVRTENRMTHRLDVSHVSVR